MKVKITDKIRGKDMRLTLPVNSTNGYWNNEKITVVAMTRTVIRTKR